MNNFQPLIVLLGTLGYTVVTFPLAYYWHVVAFKETYEQFGYITRDEPVLAFGFLSVLVQGLILSLVFPWITRGMSFIQSALVSAVTMGGFLWTTHVVTTAAKHPIEPLAKWFALETSYLAIQFVVAGCLLAFIYRATSARSPNFDEVATDG